MSSEKFFKQLIFILTLGLVIFFFYQIRSILIPWVLFFVILWAINLIPVRTTRMKEKKFQFIVGLAIILLIYIFTQFSDIFIAFLIALVLAYILDPLVDWFEARKIPRWAAIISLLTTISLVIILFFIMIIPKVNAEFTEFRKDLPEYYENVKIKLEPTIEKYTPYLEKYLEEFQPGTKKPEPGTEPTTPTISPPMLTTQHIKEILPYIRTLFMTLFNILNSITRFLIGLFAYVIIPVLLFYLLRDIDKLKDWIKDSIPKRFKGKLIEIIGQVNKAIGEYIRGIVIESILVGVCIWIGLAIFGFDYALLFGILRAIFFFVPYIGAAFWVIPAFFVGMSQFGFLKAILVVVGLNMFIYNVVTDLLLTPMVMGKAMKLHPVIIILSLLFFGKVLGFVGVIVAIPMAGILQILFQHLYAYYKESDYFKKEQVEENG